MPLLVGTRRALLGGGGGFDPRSLGNLALWLDAARITGVADTGAIAQWDDLSGNGRHATQVTAGNRPTLDSDGLNGKATVHFNGTFSQFFDVPALDLTAFSAVSVYLVVTGVTASTSVFYEMSADQSAQTDSFIVNITSGGKLDMNAKGNVGLSQFTSTASINTSAHQLTAIIDKALATNESTGWVDGSTAGTRPSNSNNTNAFGNRAGFIGARAGTSLKLVGDIAEIRIFGGAHDAATRQLNEANLKAKWGTP